MRLAARSRTTTLALVAVALAFVALVALALAPDRDGGPSVAPASAATKTVAVQIKDMAYSKKTLTVKVGQKVTWTNADSVEHDVFPDKTAKGAPHSKLLAKGKSYTWTATKKGTFKYHCSVHSMMTATVIVK